MKTHFNYFNFRVGTKLDNSGVILSKEPSRLFSIIECHYDNGKESGYGETNLLGNWESLEDLKLTYDNIQHAFKKPILDLDNWPKEFKKE